MTYRELSDWLLTLSNDQLDFMDVTIAMFDENFHAQYYKVDQANVVHGSDVVDEGHPVIVLDMGS